MPSNSTVPAKRYYPRLSSIVSPDDLPDILGFLKDGIVDLFAVIHYKDLQYNKSPRGDAAFYSLSIISKKRLDIEVPGTAIFLVLNPDFDDANISTFPITVEYEWKILAYLRDFNLEQFSFSPQAIFELALRVFNISEEQAIANFINTFTEPIDDITTPIKQFVDDVNAKLNDPGSSIQTPTEETTLSEVVSDIYNKTQQHASVITFATYILKNDQEETKDKLRTYFRSLFPQDIEEYIKDLLIPKAKATLTLSAGLEFPRTILKPVFNESGINPFNNSQTGTPLTEIPADNNGHPKVMFTFGEAVFYAGTEDGLGYNLDLALNTNYAAMLGDTGFVVDIDNLKIDISESSNIKEANDDNRPEDFKGVYADRVDIFLPPEWFEKEEGQTLAITGERLLIGTGGISGTIALRATPAIDSAGAISDFYSDYFQFNYPVTVVSKGFEENIINQEKLLLHINSLNSVNELSFKYPLSVTTSNGDLPLGTEVDYKNFISSIAPDQFMWFQFGEGGEKNWRLGFNRFELIFNQSSVTESNITARLEIPKFKQYNPQENKFLDEKLTVNVGVHFEGDGDFSITASPQEGVFFGIEDAFYIGVNSIAFGKDGSKGYFEVSGSIHFDQTDALKEIISEPIEIKKLRIYSDGSFDIEGGSIPIPASVTMNLGPVEVAITNFTLGADSINDKKYYFFGFDCGLSVGSAGLDLRGDGIQFYFADDGSDFFLRIAGIGIDLTIPGDAKPEDAALILKGYLSLREEEYVGSVAFSLPKVSLAGGAAMKMKPKVPAFVVDAFLEFTGPIPLGPTGLGIYGFRGLFGLHYVADLPAGAIEEPQKLIDFYTEEKPNPLNAGEPEKGFHLGKIVTPEERAANGNPFQSNSTPISIGAGLSLGTSFDNGYTFSMQAFLFLSIPELFAVSGRANILSKRLSVMDNEPPFYALLAITQNFITIALGAEYKLPTAEEDQEDSGGDIMELKAEAAMKFPFNNASGWEVNIGTKEDPNTVSLVKKIFKLEAFAYLMLSSQGMKTGAWVDFDFEKRYGPFRVKAEAYIGMQAEISFQKVQFGGEFSLKGGIDVDIWGFGFGLSLQAALGGTIAKPFRVYGSARVCVRIKLFFTIKKCFKLAFDWTYRKEPDLDFLEPIKQLNASDENTVSSALHLGSNSVYKLPIYKKSLAEVKNEIQNNSNYLSPIPIDSQIDIQFKHPVNSSLENIALEWDDPKHKYFIQIPTSDTEVTKDNIIKHSFNLEGIEINIWDGKEWKPYNPYEALNSDAFLEDIDDSKLRHIATWQLKEDKSFTHLRILSQSVFSYANQAANPFEGKEGYTKSALLCKTIVEDKTCIRWEENDPPLPLATPIEIEKAVLQLKSESESSVVKDLFVVDQSEQQYGLLLDNNSKLEIEFLKRTAACEVEFITFAGMYKVAFKELVFNELNHPVWETVHQLKGEGLEWLWTDFTYDAEDFDNRSIHKVVITTQCIAETEEVNELKQQLEELKLSGTLSKKEEVELRRTIKEKEEMCCPEPRTLLAKIQELIDNNSGTLSGRNRPPISQPANAGNQAARARLDRNLKKVQKEITDIKKVTNTFVANSSRSFDIQKITLLRRARLSRNLTQAITDVVSSHENGPTPRSKVTNAKATIKRQLPKLKQLLATTERNEARIKQRINELERPATINPNKIILDQAQKQKLIELKKVIEDNLNQISTCGTLIRSICHTNVDTKLISELQPSMEAEEADLSAYSDTVNSVIQPIWRPNATYVVKLDVKEEIFDKHNQVKLENGKKLEKLSTYCFPFKTGGPLGFFDVKHLPEVTKEQYRIDDSVTNSNLFQKGIELPENALKYYIDFDRSYPDPSGNLIGQKPTYYEGIEVHLFFTQKYMYHFFTKWPAYQGLDEVEYELHAEISDPVTNNIIDPTAEVVMMRDVFADPPVTIEILNEIMHPDNSVEGFVGGYCLKAGGDPLLPPSLYPKIILQNLKPSKLYNVALYNKRGDEAYKLYSFPFQTSRYANLEEQINSYLRIDKKGEIQHAIFPLEVDIDNTIGLNALIHEVDDKFKSDASLKAFIPEKRITELNAKYQDLFNKIIYGFLGLNEIAPAEATEFNLLYPKNKPNHLLGIWIRSNEPLIDPRIPIDTARKLFIELTSKGKTASRTKKHPISHLLKDDFDSFSDYMSALGQKDIKKEFCLVFSNDRCELLLSTYANPYLFKDGEFFLTFNSLIMEPGKAVENPEYQIKGKSVTSGNILL